MRSIMGLEVCFALPYFSGGDLYTVFKVCFHQPSRILKVRVSGLKKQGALRDFGSRRGLDWG